VSDPKRQHYVPKVILRNFADRSEVVDVIDLRTNARRTSHIHKVASENYFYSPLHGNRRDYSLEKWFSKVEGKIGSVFSRLIADHAWPIGTEDRGLLTDYVAIQWLRTPASRTLHGIAADRMFSGTLAEKGKSFFLEMIGEPESVATDATEVTWNLLNDVDLSRLKPPIHWPSVIAGSETLAQALSGKQMILFQSPDMPLLTTDRGVGTFPNVHESGRGFTFNIGNALHVFFPVARNLALSITDSQESDKAVVLTATQSAIVNQCLLACADQWAFHHPKDRMVFSGNLSSPPPKYVPAGD
jgi:hypothetical protein